MIDTSKKASPQKMKIQPSKYPNFDEEEKDSKGF